MAAQALWTQLNLQLIHAIDFLPPGSWQRTCNEYFFAIFVKLHGLLTRCGEVCVQGLEREETSTLLLLLPTCC